MTRLPILLVLLFFSAGARAGDDSKSDLKKMEGAWRVVIGEADGKAAGDKEKSLVMKVVVKDAKYSVYYGDKVITQGTLRLNAGKKEIDALQTDGPAKGKEQSGLYEIKGDEMRIIWAEPGQARPTSFSTGKGQVLLLYSRNKEGKK